MNIGENIKKIRKEKGLQQKEVAAKVGSDQSNYNKMENGKREPSAMVLKKLSDLFGVPVDFFFNPNPKIPKEVRITDKTANEQLQLIAQLDKEDKVVIYKMIDTMLTKKKFKQFFQDNVSGK